MASKYGNRVTALDGVNFHSRLEARRYGELKLLQAGGEIEKLRLQPRFHLTVNGVHICDYVADFAYLDRQGREVVEDAKGYKTELYKLKKKLVRAVHGINVQEVTAHE